MALSEGKFCRPDFIYIGMRRHAILKHSRLRLRAYYKGVKRERGKMTAIGRLSLPMLSSVATPRLKAKAAESRNLVPSCPCFAKSTRDAWANEECISVCVAPTCRLFIIRCKHRGGRCRVWGLHDLQSSMSRFLACWKAYGGHCVFKHHCAWHLVQRAATHGNPRYYLTYADEQENRAVGNVAKSLHGGNTFYLTFLQNVLPEVCA